jgi:hypothetical protein
MFLSTTGTRQMDHLYIMTGKGDRPDWFSLKTLPPSRLAVQPCSQPLDPLRPDHF